MSKIALACTKTIVAIPAYNEEAVIGHVVSSVREQGEEVLVVDDGSEDDTARIAREAGATLVQHESNRGYGAALQTAFSWAASHDIDALVTFDGDGQHAPSDIPAVLNCLTKRDIDIVIASRFAGGIAEEMPLVRRVGLYGISVLVNAVLWLDSAGEQSEFLWDTQSGFRAYSQRAIESLGTTAILTNGMQASVEILHHCAVNGYCFAEYPTQIRYDVPNPNTEPVMSHGYSILAGLIRLTLSRGRSGQLISALRGEVERITNRYL